MLPDLQLAQLSVHEPAPDPEPELEEAAPAPALGDQGLTAIAQYNYKVHARNYLAAIDPPLTQFSLCRPQKTTSCRSSRASSSWGSCKRTRTGGPGTARTGPVVGFPHIVRCARRGARRTRTRTLTRVGTRHSRKACKSLGRAGCTGRSSSRCGRASASPSLQGV